MFSFLSFISDKIDNNGRVGVTVELIREMKEKERERGGRESRVTGGRVTRGVMAAPHSHSLLDSPLRHTTPPQYLTRANSN